MSAAVVDSSAWIDFFRGHEVPVLEQALAEGRVRVPPLVVAELVSGASSRGDLRRVEDLVRYLELVPTLREHWVRVGELRRRLRAAGISISTPDAHVAQCALDLGGYLVATDRIFRRMAAAARLRLAP